MALRVLWVTDEVPDHRLGGGSIRQFHLLRRLSAKADVDLLMLGRLPDDDLRQSMCRLYELERPSGMGERQKWLRHRAGLIPGILPAEVAVVSPSWRALSARLPELLSTNRYDVVQVEHETLAPLARARDQAPRSAWSITLHNLLSVRLRQGADASATARVRWLFQRDALNATRLERAILRDYDQVVTVSPADAAALGGMAAVVPNGVDLDAFHPSTLPAEPRLILTGSWNWPPNVDAAVRAATEILPRVRAWVPAATLTLVGREPTSTVRNLSSVPGVETRFDVASVVPFLRSSRVAVVPLTVGSGTRLKALEALAAGRPVVGTSIGLEGLGLVDGQQARLADSPEEMAAAVRDLLTDDDAALRMAAAGRRHVEQHFGWDTVAESYYEVMMALDRPR